MRWIDNAVFYQIYPQSFKDSNGDGIGDIQGIISKLEYIKETGFNAIWINPCFDSPFMDAGYDVANFYKVAPRYGTNEDLRMLFEKAHSMDMYILLDLVPGHTSYMHPWFKESMKQEKNEYSDRYIWTDYVGRDTTTVEGVTGWLRGICDRNGSCAVNYYASQPALNYGFAEITDKENHWQMKPNEQGPRKNVDEMKKIMSFWLDMGCDGFRVDMAGSLVKNDYGQEETIKIWQDINGYIHKKYPNAVTISEWGEPTRSLRGEFDADFLLSFGPSHYMDLFRNANMLDFESNTNYFSKTGKGDLTEFKKAYMLFYEQAKNGGVICIPSGNHDLPRMTAYMDEEDIKLAFLFLFTMPGVPFIYYGDEIAMKYIHSIPSKEGGYYRTGARTPMQWDNSLNAGFSSSREAELYLPIDEDQNRPNVKQQMNDENSVYNTVKKLISLRKSQNCLGNKADFEFVDVSELRYPLAYIRSNENEKMLVVINPSSNYVECNIPKIGDVIFSIGEMFTNTGNNIKVAPCSGLVAKIVDYCYSGFEIYNQFKNI